MDGSSLLLLLTVFTAAPPANFSAKELKAFERRTVVLHLASGRELEGVLVHAGDPLLTLERAHVPTYVELSRIEAITVQPITPPTRAELEAMAKSMSPIALEIDWRSIPDDGEARTALSHAIEDASDALRRIAADSDGKEALKKVTRMSLAFASGAKPSVALEKTTLILRCDPKSAPDDHAIQSMIEKLL